MEMIHMSVKNILLGIAEGAASGMSSKAKSLSRDKRFSEEARAQYRDCSEHYGNIRNQIHDYRKGSYNSYDNDDDDYDY